MLPVTTLTINVSSVALIWFGGLRIDAIKAICKSAYPSRSCRAAMQILAAVLMATIIAVMLPGIGLRRTDRRGVGDRTPRHEPTHSEAGGTPARS